MSQFTLKKTRKRIKKLIHGGGEGAGLCGLPVSECEECPVRDKLMCEGSLLDTALLAAPVALLFFPAVAGMLRAGRVKPILFYAAVGAFFLAVWEKRLLCSHCPYYAQEGKRLRCYSHYGYLKVGRYRPAPMSRAERTGWLAFLAFLAGFPIPFLTLGRQFPLLFLSSLGIVLSALVMVGRNCPKCVNFSCPLNRVPDDVREEFFNRNETMRKAWEENGYQIGN